MSFLSGVDKSSYHRDAFRNQMLDEVGWGFGGHGNLRVLLHMHQSGRTITYRDVKRLGRVNI